MKVMNWKHSMKEMSGIGSALLMVGILFAPSTEPIAWLAALVGGLFS